MASASFVEIISHFAGYLKIFEDIARDRIQYDESLVHRHSDDYTTLRLRPFVAFDYSLGPLSARYHLELVHKTVDLLPDAARSYEVGVVVRSIGWLSAQF